MIFKVQVLDGKGFGNDTQTLVCCASFAGAAKTTQYSVAAQEHLWNSTLTWSVAREELRSATSNTNHCKISVLRKDGTCLGWVVISLRSAKLQGQYKSDSEGLWLQLNATKLAEPPQLRVAYSLLDERQLPSVQQRTSPLIMQHSDSSSSLSSKASTEPSSSDLSSGAEHDWDGREHAPAAAAAAGGSRRQSDKAGLASKERRSSAASLRPSRTGSTSRRLSAATAAGAAAGDEPAAAAAAAAAEAADQEPGSGGALLSQQLLSQDDSIGTAHQHSSSIPDAVAADADTSGAAAQGMQVLSAAAGTAQEHLSQQQQLPLSGASSSLAAGAFPATDTQTAGGVLQEGAVGAFVAESSAVGGAQLQPAAVDALSAVEARLPSFAQRRQQQQLEQQQEHAQADVPAQQQQQAADVAEQPMQFDQQAQEHLQDLPEVPNRQELWQQQQPNTAPEPASGLNVFSTPTQLAVHPPFPTVSEQPAVAAAAAAPAAAGGAASTEPAQVQGAPELSLPVPDPKRDFVLTLDVRSFQAGRRLPVALGSIYVTAWLPQEFIGFLVGQCNAKVPPRMTPLKTKPAVDIPRGSEGALPSGTGSVPFACGVMALAGQLAAEPRVTLEVWHKERLRSDLLLGVASLPLSALLQECWVDGYAPVYALMTKASTAAGSTGSSRVQQQQASLQGDEEKVQVGLLRVVMSLEEKGPAQPAAVSPAATPVKTLPSKQRQQQQQDISRVPAAAADTAQGADQAMQSQQQQALPQDGAGLGAPGAAAGAQGFRQMPEYLVAWELEVWRKAEEARFRAQLQELEQQRMGVIEAAWRAREAQRQSEIAAMKAKYTGLEKQTRELLTATQERERALLAAEAELRLRKAGLEREAAARMSEAEAAVRRLQVECEHQLGIERERTAPALKQRDAAEARTAALEAQFTEYVATQRNAPEAQLKGELAEAQQAAKAADAKLQATLKLKQKYKQQVQQLAREVAALHHKQQQDLLQQQQQQLAAALAREQDTLAAAKKSELATLREELGKLRAAAMAADAAAFAPWGGAHVAAAAAAPGSPTCSSSSLGSRYRHGERQRRHHKHGRSSRHDKENDHWQPDEPGALQHHRSAPHVSRPHRSQQQQQRSYAPNQSDSGSSSNGESSDSSTGMLRLAAERSARETAAEVATIAAMLNPPRSTSSTPAQSAGAELQQQQRAGQARDMSAEELLGQKVAGAGSAAAGSDGSSPMAEVRRLLKEKAELLATGLYGREDAVIQQIDMRVQALAELAAGG